MTAKQKFVISPNLTGYQALGSIKGAFSYHEDQTGTNNGRGILKTEYGDFPAFVHIKCRAAVAKFQSQTKHFVVWFRNKLASEENSAVLQFTIVGYNSEGDDNKFLMTAALIGGNQEDKNYQFILSRNFSSPEPTKHIVKFSTRKFRVRVHTSDNLWELYKHKLVALVCELSEGKLQVISHELVSEELPDASIVKSLKKKLKKKNSKVIDIVPGCEKQLTKKKITVGLINSDPVGIAIKVLTAKKILPISKPKDLSTAEPAKRVVLELPKK